ncbi:MAG: hypothetical protein K0R23_3097, partial [Lacrimispora sp.]|nr:hypothetical protein [Lacrimispora sp.]
TRGIQCKITVSVKRIYVGGNDIGVYLLAGEQEIYLGNIFIRGGSGEFRATVSENDIERSGINMDQCFGLTIHDVKNTWRSYTTIWEDAVAHAAAVDLEHTDSAANENSAISEEQIKKAVQEIEKEFPLEDEGSRAEKRMPLRTESLKSQEEEILLQTESSVSTDSEPSPEDKNILHEIQQMTGLVPEDGYTRSAVTGPTAGWRQGNPPSVTAPAPDWQQNTRPAMTGPIPGWWQEPRPTGPMPTAPMPTVPMPTVPMPTAPMSTESILTDLSEEAETGVQSQQEAVPFMPKPIMAESEDGGLKESVQMSSGTASLAEDDEAFAEPEAGTTRLYRADAVIKEAKNQNQTDPKLGDPEALEHLRQNESLEENVHSVVWEKLRKEHSRILAFDYEDGCEILTIKPQDIGILPRDAWVYGNNSFLLHGYYNYRYLILAKLFNSEGTPRYLLGIPGHYYSNERYMASMFGFPNFVLSKDQPMEDGRFGFWYTDIKIGG